MDCVLRFYELLNRGCIATPFLPVRGRKKRATTKNQKIFAVTSAMVHSSDNLFTNQVESVTMKLRIVHSCRVPFGQQQESASPLPGELYER